MTDSEQRPFSAVPKAEPQDDSQAAEPRTRRGIGEALGIFMLLILAAVSGGLIAVYWPWMTNTADTSDINDRVAAIETRVGQLAAGHAPKAAAEAFQAERSDLAALESRVDADEARLDALEKNGDVSPDLSARLDQDEKTLNQLSANLAAEQKAGADANVRIAVLERTAPPPDLAQRLDNFASKTDTAALDTRLAKLESRDTSAAMRRAASVLALAELVRVSENDAPFASELAALRALAPAPELDDLAHYAKGVPTRIMLTERFSNTADAVLAAERNARASNWLSKLWASFENLVSVRRVGNVKGNGAEARVARAEFDLKSGDLDGAVGELDALKGPAHDAAKPWLGDAKARLAVTRDTRALTGRIIAQLAPPQ
jgi:hypothetical protein